ncbi:choice-of-anchor Q domain-containing protein [Marinicella gelatinilytica]|uniref:choice-of-anchor Q domain-containing protein n=1 Tax=Marinicella gelatinilytica TaxID=2996017 RepID=UPI0022608E40|nr:choice-of-anchor Q domain-containing protein [Marinicella gelatinilytica]
MFVYSAHSQTSICHVSTSGLASNTGNNWQETIPLTVALSNSVFCPEIWVKEGTYYPGTDRYDTFTIQPGTEVYGGFIGNEFNRAQRDPINHKATLSGNINNVSVSGDNSFHVVTVLETSAVNDYETILDGFIIRDGFALDAFLNTDPAGGGLICKAPNPGDECQVRLENLLFTYNQAANGGAVYFSAGIGASSIPKIINTRFTHNAAIHFNLMPNNCGGAISAFGVQARVQPIFYNVEFDNNTADECGGALHYDINSGWSEGSVNSVTFSNNSAKLGGAVYSKIHHFDRTTYQNTTFYGNHASIAGGAIYNEGSTPTLNNVTVSGNSAINFGGAIHSTDADLTITNSIIWDNNAANGEQLYNANTSVMATYNVIEGGCSGFGDNGSGSTTCSANQISDPMLGTLSMNQGFTQTMLPALAGSAVDSGDNSACLSIDQRGVNRPQNGVCDIGAVEIVSICRVTTQGSPAGTGSDWNSHAMDLQTALNANNCDEIWIKTGIYKPTTTNNRQVSFNVAAGKVILGGFAGTENVTGERNIAANPVILSGDIGALNNSSDNSYHVVELIGSAANPIQPNTMIADLIIEDGHANGGSFDFPLNAGGGLFCDGSGANNKCNPTIINVSFNDNYAQLGGALYNHADNNGESSPQLINVRFNDNQSFSGGAAVYNNGSNGGTSSPIFVTATFNYNQVTSSNGGGGAVYNNANAGMTRPSFLNSSFTANEADFGGAIYSNAQHAGIASASVSQSEFNSNNASQFGGAVYCVGWNNGQCNPKYTDVTFSSNSAVKGGAVYLNDMAANGTAEFERVTFENNLGTNGGALYNDGKNGQSNPVLTNVTFHNNAAISGGGAIFNDGENGQSSPIITNVTMSQNNASYGAGMYSHGLNGVSNPVLNNVIIWANSAATDGDSIYNNNATSTINSSIIEGGCPNAGNTNCNNVINSNPHLGSLTDNGGHTDTMLPGNNSSATDAGDDNLCPGEDQRGESRPQGSACDIGSVETDHQGPSDIIFQDGFDH